MPPERSQRDLLEDILAQLEAVRAYDAASVDTLQAIRDRLVALQAQQTEQGEQLRELRRGWTWHLLHIVGEEPWVKRALGAAIALSIALTSIGLYEKFTGHPFPWHQIPILGIASAKQEDAPHD